MLLQTVGVPTQHSRPAWRQALICQLRSARADTEEVIAVVLSAVSNPDGEMGRLFARMSTYS
jgi:hypothetical protein